MTDFVVGLNFLIFLSRWWSILLPCCPPSCCVLPWLLLVVFSCLVIFPLLVYMQPCMPYMDDEEAMRMRARATQSRAPPFLSLSNPPPPPAPHLNRARGIAPTPNQESACWDVSEFRQDYLGNYTIPSHPLATSILTGQDTSNSQ
jgi:hypothetical protein